MDNLLLSPEQTPGDLKSVDVKIFLRENSMPILNSPEEINSSNQLSTFKKSFQLTAVKENFQLSTLKESFIANSIVQNLKASIETCNSSLPKIPSANLLTHKKFVKKLTHYPISTKSKEILSPTCAQQPVVHNFIVSTNLGCKLDLRYIAQHAENTEYNSKQRDVLFMRIRQPFCLAFIYSSGKLICSGAKTWQNAHLAIRKFARIIQKLGIPIKFSHTKVENIIASCKLNFPIRLEIFELFHSKYCSYEPELFTALVYRLPRSGGGQVFVFPSGNIVLSNFKKLTSIQESFMQFYTIVQPFRKISLQKDC